MFTENTYAQQNRPSESIIEWIVERFERRESMEDQRTKKYNRSYL